MSLRCLFRHKWLIVKEVKCNHHFNGEKERSSWETPNKEPAVCIIQQCARCGFKQAHIENQKGKKEELSAAWAEQYL